MKQSEKTLMGLEVEVIVEAENPVTIVNQSFEPIGEEPRQESIEFTIRYRIEDEGVHVVIPKSDVEGVRKEEEEKEEKKAITKLQRRKKSHPEIHRIFWRAFSSLQIEAEEEPGYKRVWDAVRQDVVNDKGGWKKREFDPHEYIEENGVDPSSHPDPKLRWVTHDNQGAYRLSSLSSLLSRLKNKPPSAT